MRSPAFIQGKFREAAELAKELHQKRLLEEAGGGSSSSGGGGGEAEILYSTKQPQLDAL